MAIGIGVERLSAIMNAQYASYRGMQTGLTLLGTDELATFDEAIPKLLNRYYKPRVSGVLYATFAGAYLVGLMKAKKALGGSMYSGNDGDSGILSRELSPDMFADEAGDQKKDAKCTWNLTTQPTSAGWQSIIGASTSTSSVISNDEFGSIVISHITNVAPEPNLLEVRYHINGNPKTPQYIEPAFKLNDNQTYQFDVPIMLVKNTKLYVEGNVETAYQPVGLMQGGICFATANWLNSQTVSMT